MKPILQNLVEMTGHRDHLRLEVSVLSTLQSMSAVVQVRSLEIFTLNGACYVRPSTCLRDGQWVSNEAEAAHDPLRQPLADLPALQECIASNAPRATTTRRIGCISPVSESASTM